jgi:hypothetical protein
MEEHGNKTIMCSVLFLDIVEYSKKSVSGQISLKDRFNAYLSAAIRDIPITDRIILDTGDGAAINFLGDVEDALKTAINLRESLLKEGINATPPLLVRMGVNLGPVRLVRDINGQPNIVGDGINVAQRVMGFADIAQILVSRSYYDAVSRLSPQYAGMFHYQGSRTDKHVREHEVYAIGYPADRAIQKGKQPSLAAEKTNRISADSLEQANTGWHLATSRLGIWTEHLGNSLRQAEPKQRAIYIAVTVIPLALIIGFVVSMVRHDRVPGAPGGMNGQVANALQSGSSVAPVSESTGTKTHGTRPEQSTAAPKPKTRKTIDGKKPKDKARHTEGQAKAGAISTDVTKSKRKDEVRKTDVSAPSDSVGTFVSVSCKGAELFVDGTRKGRIGDSPLAVAVSPGKHTVIVSHAKGISSQDIAFAAGKTVRLSPDFCK